MLTRGFTSGETGKRRNCLELFNQLINYQSNFITVSCIIKKRHSKRLDDPPEETGRLFVSINFIPEFFYPANPLDGICKEYFISFQEIVDANGIFFYPSLFHNITPHHPVHAAFT